MFNILTIDIEDYFQVHAFSNVIKFEDWGNYECRIERNVDRLLDILNDSKLTTQNFKNGNSITHSLNNSLAEKVRGTFFVLGWLAERYPNLIKRIKDQGHEIACHGYAHQLVYNQSKAEFREDIRKTKAILEDILGSEVIGYRAPGYSITNKSQWAFEILAEEGFKYDSSIFPIHHDFYGFPSAPRFPFLISLNGNNNFEFSVLSDELNTFQNSKLKANNSLTHSLINPSSDVSEPHHGSPAAPLEGVTPNSELRTQHYLLEFPISTVKVFGQNFPISGGGYFRLFPYPLIKSALGRINEKEQKPFIFYIHPWEIDFEQPRIRGLKFKSRLRHYINLDKTENKFKRLLEDFKFSTIRQILIQNS